MEPPVMDTIWARNHLCRTYTAIYSQHSLIDFTLFALCEYCNYQHSCHSFRYRRVMEDFSSTIVDRVTFSHGELKK